MDEGYIIGGLIGLPIAVAIVWYRYKNEKERKLDLIEKKYFEVKSSVSRDLAKISVNQLMRNRQTLKETIDPSARNIHQTSHLLESSFRDISNSTEKILNNADNQNSVRQMFEKIELQKQSEILSSSEYDLSINLLRKKIKSELFDIMASNESYAEFLFNLDVISEKELNAVKIRVSQEKNKNLDVKKKLLEEINGDLQFLDLYLKNNR